MAIQSIVEPYVKVSERIREYPVQLGIDGSSNIGGVIVAPTGPRLAYIKGPKEFLDTYTVDGNIPRNADITLLNAYYLSFSTGLVLVRSMNTEDTNGVGIKVSESKSYYRTPILVKPGNWYLMDDTTVFYYTETGESIEVAFPDLNLENLSPVVVSGIDDLVSKLSESGIDVQYDSVNEVIYSTDEFEFTTGGELTLGDSNSQTGVIFDIKPLDFKGGDLLVDGGTLNLNITAGTPGWGLRVGTMLYYFGAIDKTNYNDYSQVYVEGIEDLATKLNSLNGISASFISDSKIEIKWTDGNELDENDFQSIDDNALTVSFNPDNVEDKINAEDYLVTINPSLPHSDDIFSVTIKQGSKSDLYELALGNNGEKSTYTVSFDPDGVDEFGNNCYIDNLNTMNTGFTFKVNPDKYVVGQDNARQVSAKFGKVSSFNPSEGSKPMFMKQAIRSLEVQDKYDIEYLSAFGVTDLEYIREYISVGASGDWFTPVDIPFNKSNQNSIRSYFLNVANSSNVLAIGPFDKNIGLTGWMVYIAPSTLYYTRVLANKAAGKEFAPVFDLTNGILDYTNPVYQFDKKIRTELLNAKCPINFVVYDERSQVFYFNDNRTHQSNNNIVSEEQNRRIINKIKKASRTILRTFKGRFNTTTTRGEVVSAFKNYFSTNIMNQSYSPDEYQVICDESNNTAEIINANKLAVTVRIRLYNSIKFIDVLVDVFPLGVDFES